MLNPDPALVKGYTVNERPAVYALLAKYPDRHAIILKSRAEADRWLNECL